MSVDKIISKTISNSVDLKSGTAKENIQLPQVVFLALLNYEQACRDVNVETEQLSEIAMSIASLIPSIFKDKLYEESMKKAKQIINIDIRPENCGEKTSIEICEQLGIQTIQTFEKWNHHQIKQSITDLIQRRGLGFKFENKEEGSKAEEDLPK